MLDRILQRLLGCERGNAALVSAATLPLLLTSAALAYDTVQLALWNHQLQQLANAGAIAGARALAHNQPVGPAVERSVGGDPRIRIAAPAMIERAPVRGLGAGDPHAVRVMITSQRALPFLGALLSEPPTRSAEATATLVDRPVGDRADPIELIH